MKYIYITNDPELAKYACDCGIDNIMIDLETIGKDQRQKNLDTVKSSHEPHDIKHIKKHIKNSKSKIITRINPLHKNSKIEINTSIKYGTDYIMLPMFNNKNEVKEIIDLIDNRVKLILLFETPKSIINIDSILELKKIDEAFIGLNDLSIAFNLNFMFELLPSSLIELMTKKFKKRKIPFGIGGISRIGSGKLDSKLILSEHVRLGSTKVIISRSFTNKAKNLMELNRMMDLQNEISLLTSEYNSLKKLNYSVVSENKKQVLSTLEEIVK